MYISSASIIIFAEFHDLSCVKVQANWYIAFLRVSLRVSSLEGVGVTQNISVLCKGASNVGSCVFSLIYLFICSFWIIIHIWFLVPSVHSLRFGSRIWKVNIDQNSNPFFHFFQRNPVIHDLISQENVFSFGIYSNKNMKLGSEKFYVSWLPITVFATTWIENNVWKYMNIIFMHCGEEMRYKRSSQLWTQLN